jgi:SAM-dependent methyltransferase
MDPPLSFALRLLAEGGGPVLVLGAGVGRVAVSLGAKGHDVVAQESSSRLLALAIERREAEARGARVRFLNADARTLEVGRTFPLVLALENALGTMGTPADGRAFIAALARHLTPTGTFALDVWSEGSDEVDGPARSRLRRPHLRQRDAMHRLGGRRWSPLELEVLLQAHGLEARERYADYGRTPWEPGAARLVVVGGFFARPAP